VALVGFSSGAYLAVSWALDLASAAGAAVLGGAAMAEAVRQSPPHSLHGKAFRAFANAGDTLLPAGRLLRDFLGKKGVSAELDVRPGDHVFSDYARNGSVTAAFTFALSLLRRPGS